MFFPERMLSSPAMSFSPNKKATLRWMASVAIDFGVDFGVAFTND
jgi:hypothetical protein